MIEEGREQLRWGVQYNTLQLAGLASVGANMDNDGTLVTSSCCLPKYSCARLPGVAAMHILDLST
jgi:hypothetical protein